MVMHLGHFHGDEKLGGPLVSINSLRHLLSRCTMNIYGVVPSTYAVLGLEITQ